MKADAIETYRVHLLKLLTKALPKQEFGPRERTIVSCLYNNQAKQLGEQAAFVKLYKHFGNVEPSEANRAALAVEKQLTQFPAK
jgi:hypothetical protein